MNELRTDDRLLRRIAAAASRSLTADEISRQKISFIIGSLSDDSTVTRAQIKSVLAKHDGEKTAA